MNNNLFEKALHYDKLITDQIINYNGVKFEDYFNYYYLSKYLEKEVIKLYEEIRILRNENNSNSKIIELRNNVDIKQNLLNSCNAKINYINSNNLRYLEVLNK